MIEKLKISKPMEIGQPARILEEKVNEIIEEVNTHAVALKLVAKALDSVELSLKSLVGEHIAASIPTGASSIIINKAHEAYGSNED